MLEVIRFDLCTYRCTEFAKSHLCFHVHPISLAFNNNFSCRFYYFEFRTLTFCSIETFDNLLELWPHRTLVVLIRTQRVNTSRKNSNNCMRLQSSPSQVDFLEPR